MDFKENFCFAYVSDNLQHFSKFDLFDLYDLHFHSRSKIYATGFFFTPESIMLNTETSS